MPKNWNTTVSIQEAKAAYAVEDDLGAYCFLYEGDRVRPVRQTISGNIVTLPPYVPPATLYTKTDRFIISLIADIEPVQSGSGDPSPDNVRPISGWTGAKVTRCGVNLLTSQYVKKDGNSYYVGANSSNEFPFFLKAGNYTFSNKGTVAYCYWRQQGTDHNNVIHNATVRYGTFTVPEDDYYRFWFYSIDADASFTELQLELGSTATAYEPYSGQTYPITFPSEAGTVYGGTLDVTTGVLTVTDAQIASYNGEALPSTWISDRDIYAEGTTPTTGAQVVYKLGTPQTYQLTPTEVMLLSGENNIFADTGPIILNYVETQEVTNE